MVRRWALAVGVVVAAMTLAGVGFAVFTASASVNGLASSGTAALLVTEIPGTPAYCTFPGGVPDPFATLTVAPSGVGNLSVTAGNLVPGVYCTVPVEVINTGTVPLALTANLLVGPGVCPPGATNGCFDAGTLASGSGLDAIAGLVTNAGLPSLAPGGAYADTIFVGAPTSFSVLPPTGTFTVEYVGVA